MKMKSQRSSTTEFTKKSALAAVLVALGVALSPFTSIPLGIALVNPTQQFINVISAVLLGPWWAVSNALAIGILRNALGTGTLLAFPGGMIGALLAGFLYRWTHRPFMAAAGEVFGTGVLAVFVSVWWIAPAFLHKSPSLVLLWVSFAASTLVGAGLALGILKTLQKTGIIRLPGSPRP
jgi:energy-coupling factor transport system ATP-binding protein